MATYNGIKYIDNQVRSIMEQLNESDELIISDDGSSDGTWEYLLELAKKHKNIKVVRGPQKGTNANFFSVIHQAKRHWQRI